MIRKAEGSRHGRRQIVPSGEFAVRRAGEGVLEAYLGTCVGVAIWDEQAQVGGIYHALLGEPLSPGMESHNPCRYAVSGLPLFMETLLENGADQRNLKAAVAGGAIVGPSDEVRIDLQIGSKTLEKVTSYLSATHIPVVLSETGGTFTCALCLDCRTWQPDIQPIGTHFAPPSSQRPSAPLEKEALPDLLEQVRPIPQTAFKILNLLRTDTYDISEVSREIGRDQVLAARLLGLCNSPLFGTSGKVTSLDRAVVLLGEKRILQIAFSVFLSSVFPSGPGGYSLCKGGLFQHSVGTALIAEFLTRTTGGSPGKAYTNGLLHDIGKVVLDQAVVTQAPLFYRKAMSAEGSLVSVEREVFGTDHTQAGGALALHWGLPAGTIQAVSRHHDEAFAHSGDTDAAVLVLADFIANRFLSGTQLERMDPELVVLSLKRLGIGAGELERIVEALPLEAIRSHAAGF
ncbi:MAG: HDOD domain-containing protein [Desulfacinum sp.]|nr:HDOD domain-containing protein [Desulfacinum sp.]